MRSPTLAYPGNPQWGIRFFESNYDRPRRVEVVNLTGILAGCWFQLFHCAEFSTLTLPYATLELQCEKTSRRFLPDTASVELVMGQFKRQFGNRKRIRKTEWQAFCYSIKDQEVPEVIGEAHFFTVTGERAYSGTMTAPFELTQPLDPQATYLQGASWVESVNVLPAYQKKGIGTTLYTYAESIFEMPIIPAYPLSEAGLALHRKLGKIV